MNYFAKINGLPEYGDRVNIFNININGIITLKVKNIPIFCKVIGTTPTMIKVIDLDIAVTNECIKFKLKNSINITTKGYLTFTRKIYKLNNVIYLENGV